MESFRALFQQSLELLQNSHPLWLIASMALLPLAGVPVSPLWVLGGMRFGALWGALIVVLTSAVNIAAAYGLAANWLRVPLEKLLATRGFNLPVLGDRDERSFILLCRVTPGIPLVVQNYLLGCARVNFAKYFLYSLPFVSGYGVAFVVFGDSLADSRLWQILLALCLIVAIVLAVRLIRRRAAAVIWLSLCLVRPSSAEIFVVTNQADAGPGSLRQAILDSNATPGTNAVLFALPGPGPFAIQPVTPLPALRQPLFIDGASQPEFSGAPVIELDGAMAIGGDGLDIATSDCSVRGLAINRFSLAGIRLRSGDNHLIQGNFIGTDLAGALARPNSFGIVIDADSSRNTIGGPSPEARNVISANRATGLLIQSTNTTGNVVQGNLIGLAAGGGAALGNGTFGIAVVDSPRNTLGGPQPGAGNVLSGNGKDGLFILGLLSQGNVVQGNLVGTDLWGLAALGNHSNGVAIAFAPGTTIGGPEAGAGNVISGNAGHGIELAASAGPSVIQGNRIGADAPGFRALGNARAGLLVLSPANTIGGKGPGEGNLISGNRQLGLVLAQPEAAGNVVEGNFIGTDGSGARALPNRQAGLAILGGASSNLIGGQDPHAGNVLSGNSQEGLKLEGPENFIQGNWIGTGASGAHPVPNRGDGIGIGPGGAGNVIGGSAAGEANRIAFNGGDGIRLAPGAGAGNAIVGNSVSNNQGLGIRLQAAGASGSGPTPNDPLDTDLGPNRLQNHPAITNVSHAMGVLTLQGVLSSAPDASFAIDIYASASPDPSGFGEGETFLGSVSVDTDAEGRAGFAFEAAGGEAGWFFTATAIDLATGDTSEFGPSIPFPGTVTIVSISQAAEGIRIAFTTEAEGEYRLEWTASSGDWEPVPGAESLAGTGGIVAAVDPGSLAQRRFYRVRKLP